MRIALTKILDDCIEQVMKGETIEDALAKYPEVCIGMLYNYEVIRIPDEDVLIDFNGFIVITTINIASGVIPYRLNFRNIFTGHSLSKESITDSMITYWRNKITTRIYVEKVSS